MENETLQAWVNAQIGAAWLDLDKHCAWHGGFILDQVVVRCGDEGWQVILKAYRGQTAYVAFIPAETLAEAYELTGEHALRGWLTWDKDKWPSKRLKKLLRGF